jgi:3-oxoacyl-[acyl-carrier protein] reductase
MRNSLLQNKTAIVTGGGSGIGKAIATLFHQQGANVVVADLDLTAATQTASDMAGGNGLALRTDVAEEASVMDLIAKTRDRFGSIDILVNCAGVPQTFIPVEALDESKWDMIMGVNAKSIFLTAKHAVPHMKKAGGGAIVNICSIVGVRPKPGQLAYCASKGAAIVISQSLALELAPYKIRVNAINPGAAETPMLGKFLDAEADLALGKKAFASNIPLGVLVQPDDIAEAALYLASPLSKIITGSVMNVDGGRAV